MVSQHRYYDVPYGPASRWIASTRPRVYDHRLSRRDLGFVSTRPLRAIPRAEREATAVGTTSVVPGGPAHTTFVVGLLRPPTLPVKRLPCSNARAALGI